MNICKALLWGAVTISTAGAAAAQAPGSLARVFYVDVKSGQAPAFEAGLKAHIEWRKAQGDPWEWSVAQIVDGERLGDYIIRSDGHSWSDFDAYQEFLEKGAVHFYASVGSSINSMTSAITSLDLEHMRWPQDPAAVNLVTLTTYYLKMGKQQLFNEVIGKSHQAILESEWPVHYAWQFVMSGGEPGTATLASPYARWADMEGPDTPFPVMLAKALGEEEANRLMENLGEATRSAKSSVARYRRDLSLLK